MNLIQMLEERAEASPSRVAISFGRERISYRKLNALVNQLAWVLIKLGLREGEKVGILLDNCPEFIISYFAILKAGGVVVPLNTFLKEEELAFILNDCSVVLLITQERFPNLKDRVSSMRTVLLVGKGEKGFSLRDLMKGESTTRPEGVIEEEATAAILYTSGTTGHPKGVMLTHKNLISNINSCTKAIRVSERDRFLIFLPIFHSFTFTVCVLIPILVGARMIILSSPKPFTRILKAIMFGRVTVFVAIPSVYNILGRIKVPRLFRLINPIKVCVSGAAPLAVETLKGFEERFGIPLLEGYGLTEASPVVCFNPLDGERRPGSVGLPIPGVEVKVVDEEERELPKGEVGELIVRGPNVMAGYYNLDEETKKAIRGGWLFTGDMARVDEEGYIYIVDRKKELILFRGMNVYPSEVERVIRSHPCVKEVAVVGKRDPHHGEIPVALIVVEEGKTLSQDEVISLCKERLAYYKVPKSVIFSKELPKTPTGKILKREIVV
jgi:long-chain acyl-CoA synthetase